MRVGLPLFICIRICIRIYIYIRIRVEGAMRHPHTACAPSGRRAVAASVH